MKGIKINRTSLLRKLLTLPLCLLFVWMAYNSSDYIFYEFDEDATAYTVSSESSGREGLNVEFIYNDKEIVASYGSEIESSKIKFYGKSELGTVVMTDENLNVITEDYVGSFFAKAAVIYLKDATSGNRIRLYSGARTDMEFSQLNEKVSTLYEVEVSPLDILFNNRDEVQIYYMEMPLANTDIEVTYADSSVKTLTSDENGYLSEISASDAKEGFSISYNANETDYYILSYIVQTTYLFSVEHFEAIIPSLIIIMLSIIGIVISLIIRRYLFRKNAKMERFTSTRNGILLKSMPKKPRSKFMIFRWIIMILSTVFVIYGGRLLGIWFDNISLPILVCEENYDQFVLGSCFYLANLDLLFLRPIWEIVLYFATFIGSLILLGRILCGFFCPMGLLQDIIYKSRQWFNIEGLPFNDKMYDLMKPIKWIMLVLMLGLVFMGGKFCDICPAKSLSPALNGFQASLYISGFIMVIAIIGSFFKRRFWCTICPLGYVMGWVSKISIFKLKKDCDACTSCGACYDACPMGIKTIYTERDKTNVTEVDCIMCGECVRSCPENDALAITVLGKGVYTASRSNVVSCPKKDKKNTKERKQNYNE